MENTQTTPQDADETLYCDRCGNVLADDDGIVFADSNGIVDEGEVIICGRCYKAELDSLPY